MGVHLPYKEDFSNSDNDSDANPILALLKFDNYMGKCKTPKLKPSKVLALPALF